MKVTAAEPGKVPAEVRKYLKEKGLTPSWDWDDVWQEEHAAAFTAAKAMGQDVLEALRKAVDSAIEAGQPFPEFKKRVRDVLAELGWWGVQDRENPKTGEVERVELGTPRRLKTIYVTNARVARAVGQWERIQRTKDSRPWSTSSAPASATGPSTRRGRARCSRSTTPRGARCSRRTAGAVGAASARYRSVRPTTWAARARLPWASRPAALTLAPPDETNLEDLSAVADGRGPEARPGAVS